MKTFVLKQYILALFISLAFSCSNDGNDESVQDENTATEVDMAEEILNIVNTHRQNIGQAPLVSNDLATQLAVEHTEYMISINDINHDNFDQRANKLSDAENATSMGENVAVRYSTATAVVQGWLDSDGHRKNIEGNYTHTGIAVVKDSEGIRYFTQIFYR